MPEPRYRQIAEDLRLKIEAGELVPGSCIPAEVELLDRYEASRNTVRDAVRMLLTWGLVEVRPGQGTFVVEKSVPFVTVLTRDPEAESGLRGEDRAAAQEQPQVEIVPWYAADYPPVSDVYTRSSPARGAPQFLEGFWISDGVTAFLQALLELIRAGDDPVPLTVTLYPADEAGPHGPVGCQQGTRTPCGLARSGTRWKLARSGTRCGLARSGRQRWRHDKPASCAPFRSSALPHDEHQEQRRSREVIKTGDRAPSVRRGAIRRSRTRV